MTKMRVEELDTTLRELLARVEAGETIVIASDGKDVAEISPCDRFAEMERVFPGMIRSTKPASSIRDIEPMRLTYPVDAVELIREQREDREFLR